jgi:hypothetical protein
LIELNVYNPEVLSKAILVKLKFIQEIYTASCLLLYGEVKFWCDVIKAVEEEVKFWCDVIKAVEEEVKFWCDVKQ